MTASDFFKGINPIRLIKDEKYLYQQTLNLFEHDPKSRDLLEKQLEQSRQDPKYERLKEDQVRFSLMMGIGVYILVNNAPCMFSRSAAEHIYKTGHKIMIQKLNEMKTNLQE